MVHVFMFQNLLFACALTSTLGFASIKEDIKPSYKSDEISFHLDNKKMVSYDDVGYQITFNANELNNYHWDNFGDYLLSIEASVSTLFVNYDFEYNSVPFSYSDWDAYQLDYQSNDAIIQFLVDGPDANTFAYYIYSGEDEIATSFEYDLIWTFGSDVYSAIKSAIELDVQANTPSDNMPQVLDDFVGVLTTAIGSLASGIAGGVTAMAQDLFLQDDGEGNITGLSVFGGIVALFAGLALAVGITTKVYTWVTTLGN